MLHLELITRDYFHGSRRAAADLHRHPELWDANPFRTQGGPGSPFHGTSDIWVRWRRLDECTSRKAFIEPHFPVFYPAWYDLPDVWPIVFDLMANAQATALGGILITRVPAGGEIKAHTDAGGWHAEFYRYKVYVPLQTNDRCVNWCEDEEVVMGVGEAWRFNNLVQHGLRNEGPTDRISLIVCMRTEP